MFGCLHRRVARAWRAARMGRAARAARPPHGGRHGPCFMFHGAPTRRCAKRVSGLKGYAMLSIILWVALLAFALSIAVQSARAMWQAYCRQDPAAKAFVVFIVLALVVADFAAGALHIALQAHR